MTQKPVLRLCALLALVAGVVVSAQIILPQEPPKEFGASISPSFEGWFDNPDGTHSFLIGYYNRNTEEEVDVPIGPNNMFEPGPADRGQPEHFLTRRHFGVFQVTVPAAFPTEERLWWNLTVNGVTSRVPVHMHINYNISPFKGSEESPDGRYPTPPTIRLSESGPKFQGPRAPVVEMTAKVGTPMPINLWGDDTALYSSGGGAPREGEVPAINVQITPYRHSEDMKIANRRPRVETTMGGKPLEPYSGHTSTAVTFGQPGTYMLHVNVGNYTSTGGGSSAGCCWTTVLLKITVTE